MSDLEDNMNQLLNIEPQKPAPLVRSKKVIDMSEDDFEVARRNIRELLMSGDDALEGILDLARTGEHPRAYEVAGQLIKTLVDANKDLLNLHKQNKEIKGAPESSIQTTKIGNAVFVGTTADLLELKKSSKEK